MSKDMISTVLLTVLLVAVVIIYLASRYLG